MWQERRLLLLLLLLLLLVKMPVVSSSFLLLLPLVLLLVLTTGRSMKQDSFKRSTTATMTTTALRLGVELHLGMLLMPSPEDPQAPCDEEDEGYDAADCTQNQTSILMPGPRRRLLRLL